MAASCFVTAVTTSTSAPIFSLCFRHHYPFITPLYHCPLPAIPPSFSLSSRGSVHVAKSPLSLTSVSPSIWAPCWAGLIAAAPLCVCAFVQKKTEGETSSVFKDKQQGVRPPSSLLFHLVSPPPHFNAITASSCSLSLSKSPLIMSIAHQCSSL